ncbi:DUF1365 domain-containing protein [Mycobacterium deserti]|uniref:DUF1365 family protein n=1 Tax=Mycobacterium deserti TaxID=2978347 RepID=A0ABT2M8Z6_9MYCO|nr:DUF1365 family protein [Mycobacterium deserti]MCT7657466.1 DUF1365 family protein [Mycobacterium deserti]
MDRPYLYRTRVTHLRRAPVHHYFEHSGYSWYVDVDSLPRLPRWLRPFARFDAGDHFDGAPGDSLRTRVEAFLRERGVDPDGGKITALLQARVLGYEFNPVSLFWCHDSSGIVRHVVMEMHNTRGGRHAYLLPPGSDPAAMAMKKLRVSPFHGVDGYYLVRAPRPGAELDVTVSLHRDNEPAFVATVRGTRRPGGVAELLRMQAVAPMAPMMAALEFRVQNLTLMLRRVPVVNSVSETRSETAPLLAAPARSR